MNRKLLIIAALIFSTVYIFPQKVGDAYRFNINNLNIPINRVGTIADVNIPPDGTLGRFGNSSFLFSSGFFMSGLTNGNLWAFAQATASLVENMTPGTVASGPNDPDAVIYVVNGEDEPFGESWQDWKTVVDKFGADFYDGNGDGVYDPIDMVGPNGEPLNGVWDPWEDMPDLLGDETAWCVYTDGQPGAQRLRFAGVNPQGIEIRQTLFGFASKGALGNMIFIRYRLRNTGLVADVLDSVYFGAWADSDLGAQFDDDLVGVDVPRNAGFTYNGDDDDPGGYEAQIPCYMIDLFSGPKVFIPGVTFVDNDGDGKYTEGVDTPLDTAFSFRGQNLGIKEFPGAKNLDVSSFVHYIASDPIRGDPSDEFEARNYMHGHLKLGQEIDPCNDAWGDVFGGVDCLTIDPRFWYSGDPVTGVGWINNRATDQRQMTNVGPFQLVKGEEDLEIVVAYVVGQGSDRLNSITVARNISDIAQSIYDSNFDFPVGIKGDNPDQIPNNFYLFQNFPNPFNPTTKIKYSVSSNVKRETSNVSLKVYDVLGNEIATLVNEELPAGEYEVVFNPASGIRNLVSGIYFYQLKAGNFIETKKMILLK